VFDDSNYDCFLAEIQQVLKKVEEGLLLFDDIWEKVKFFVIQINEKYSYNSIFC
jgi:hypothetical protein